MVRFASSEGRHLSDSVVDSHVVGVLRELGDDFSRAHPLSPTCYHGDIDETLFWGCVHMAFDLGEGLCEIPYGKVLTKMSTSFVLLPVAFMSGVLVVVGFIRGCLRRKLVCRHIFELTVGACP
jgi:hypothetical protein